MENAKAIELLNKALGCVQTDPRNCGECKKCENYATKEDGIEAIRTAIEALKKAPTALDHIHNVVRDDAYKRGYEQAKEDCIKAVRDCYENILDVETDGHTIADSVEDIITERVRGTT